MIARILAAGPRPLGAGPLALWLAACPFGAVAAPSVMLEELSVTSEGSPAQRVGSPPPSPGFGVAAPPNSAPLVIDRPVGQVVTEIGRENTIANRPATSIGSVLVNSPGVTVRQGNGARDVIVSIRGNNARSTGVIKNTIVLEDGFILTQPDGAARFDLTDPRAYSRIDVFRGPQSALFGNYATGARSPSTRAPAGRSTATRSASMPAPSATCRTISRWAG